MKINNGLAKSNADAAKRKTRRKTNLEFANLNMDDNKKKMTGTGRQQHLFSLSRKKNIIGSIYK